jgi:IclR family acetate operon transcriptional repressor
MVHIVKHHSSSPLLDRAEGTQAVGRAFAILGAFSDTDREWTLAGLTRRLKLTKPTALRLLGVLEREGMVSRAEPGGAYRLGPRAIQIGALAQRSTDLLTAARPELESLARATGETASLEMLAGHEILVLAEVRGRRQGSWVEFVGARWPAHAAATGKVLLAAAQAERSEAWRRFTVLARIGLPRYTRRTITSLPRFEQALRRVSREGIAVADQELEPGYVALGAPVTNHLRRVVAAICLGGHASRLTPERRPALGHMVLDAAARISQELGAPASGAGSAA